MFMFGLLSVNSLFILVSFFSFNKDYIFLFTYFGDQNCGEIISVYNSCIR